MKYLKQLWNYWFPPDPYRGWEVEVYTNHNVDSRYNPQYMAKVYHEKKDVVITFGIGQLYYHMPVTFRDVLLYEARKLCPEEFE